MELRLISTTYEGKERITREQTIPFCDDGGREEQLINLYPQVIYQQMDGFGGAITDSAAYIYSLPHCQVMNSRKRQPQRKIFVAAVLIGGLKQKNPRLYQGNKNFSIA